MAQIKVYGRREHLRANAQRLSDAIHTCVMDALQYPAQQRFHRFLELDDAFFFYPEDRGEAYTIIEISLFEGRSVEAKEQLIHQLFAQIQRDVGIAPESVEITIFETPRCNWGIRGQTGDKLRLDYQVGV